MSRLTKRDRIYILELATEIAAEAAQNPGVIWMIEFQEQLVESLYRKMTAMLEADLAKSGRHDEDEDDEDDDADEGEDEEEDEEKARKAERAAKEAAEVVKAPRPVPARKKGAREKGTQAVGAVAAS